MVRSRFQALLDTSRFQALGRPGGVSELVHSDIGFAECQCAAAKLRDEIQLACREWDVLLSALIMVCAALIVMPIINFMSAGAVSTDDDGTGGFALLHGSDIHYYLRGMCAPTTASQRMCHTTAYHSRRFPTTLTDIFNLTVGIVAIFLALMETASLTNECNRCIEKIFVS